MRRGLTIIEILLALSILTGLMLASTAWVQVAARSASHGDDAVRWRMAADACLQRIAEDLLGGDWPLEPDHDRVEVEDDVLTIGTRDGDGAAISAYRLDAQEQALTRTAHDRTRILIVDAFEFACKLDDETGVLDVSLVGPRNLIVSRRYRVR